MWLLIAEALAALALLVFIVAWTMSGRRRSEERQEVTAAGTTEADDAPTGEPGRH